ncbi:MAG: LytTR family DNA-binding domain-containing protein, partial [Psychroflexus sp.]|nr:LytTR family DNA-binding domain-containing protein [Psychroflexus sp.]
MNCIVIDDEPLARVGMKELISNFSVLNQVGEFNNTSNADRFLNDNKVDLIFLDIEIPGVDGLEFAKTIAPEILIIFTTAYKEYAVESYAFNAIDYLLKPILLSRFEKSVTKATKIHQLLSLKKSEVKNITKEYVFIKADRRYYKVLFQKILYIEGLKDYVVIHTDNDKIITAMNLKTIHQKLPQDKFIRVSKSYIVNSIAIESFDRHTVFIQKNEIPIGSVYQEAFFKQYLGE